MTTDSTGGLKEAQFPYLASTKTTSPHIIVFMVGGFTYEEVCAGIPAVWFVMAFVMAIGIVFT